MKKTAKKAAKNTRRPIRARSDWRLALSFDSQKLRGEFVEWLRQGAGKDFEGVLIDDRGSTLDIDYDSDTLVVVNEFTS